MNGTRSGQTPIAGEVSEHHLSVCANLEMFTGVHTSILCFSLFKRSHVSSSSALSSCHEQIEYWDEARREKELSWGQKNWAQIPTFSLTKLSNSRSLSKPSLLYKIDMTLSPSQDGS